MSWTPDIWIRKKDYEKLITEISELKVDAWEFEVGLTNGVVLSAGETSSKHRELHDVVISVPHWLLNSERSICDNCNEWGKQILWSDK